MADTQTYYYRQILPLIRKGNIDPLYLIYGEEQYLMDSLVEQIATAFVGELQKEINYFVRYAPDCSLDDLLALTAGAGLFSSRKVIVYRDYQNLRNVDHAGFKKYLERPTPDICLILMARTATVTQARYKILRGHARLVNVPPLREGELHTWVEEEFARHGKKATAEAVRTLVYLVGGHIHDLQTEITQVVNFFQDEETILPEHIEKVVGIYVTQSVFELTGAIARKDVEKSLFILHNLLEKGESPGSILFWLIRHITILWKIRGFYHSGIKNRQTIQERLKIYPRHYQQYETALAHWSLAQLQASLGLIKEADRLLKSTPIAAETILDILVVKLAKLSVN